MKEPPSCSHLPLTSEALTQQPTGKVTWRRDMPNSQKVTVSFLRMTSTNWNGNEPFSNPHSKISMTWKCPHHFHANSYSTGKHVHDTKICRVCLVCAAYYAFPPFHGSSGSLDYCDFSPCFSVHIPLHFFFGLSLTTCLALLFYATLFLFFFPSPPQLWHNAISHPLKTSHFILPATPPITSSPR